MKQAIYPFVKWGARISIVVMIFLPSLFYTAYTTGIITPFPFGQLYFAVMHHPVTAMVLKLAIISIAILISFIEVQNVHGSQATERIRACIRCLFSAPWLALALLLFGTHFIIDSSPFNGPLNALAVIPTLWFIGLLLSPTRIKITINFGTMVSAMVAGSIAGRLSCPSYQNVGI